MSNSITRKGEEKSTTVWISRFFLIILNILLIYLLLGYIEYLYVVLALTGIFLVALIIFAISRNRDEEETDFPKSKRSIRDTFWLARKYVLINKKFILTSIVGLILATLVISQAMLFSESYRQDSFDQFVERADSRALIFEIEGIVSLDNFQSWETIVKNNAPTMLQDYDLEVTTISSYIQYKIKLITGEAITSEEDGREIPNISLKTRSIVPEALDFLKEFPTFDKSINSLTDQNIIIIANEKVISSNLQSSTSAPILTDNIFKVPGDNSTFASITLNDTYIWKVSNLDQNYFNNNQQLFGIFDVKFAELIEESSLLLKDGTEWDVFNTLKANVPPSVVLKSLDQGQIITEVRVKLPDLKEINLLELRSTLGQLENFAESWAYANSGLTGFEIDTESPLRESINDYLVLVGAFDMILFIIAGILSSVAIFLVYYSLTLVEQRKQKLIAILKYRGSSKGQLDVMLYAEAISAAIIAIVVGMILSIPWTSMALRSSGLLEYDATSIQLSIPDSWFWRLPLIGLILALDLNFYSIYTLSNIRIDEGEEASEKTIPVWQRLYLDVLLVTISIVFWFVIRYIPFRNRRMFDILVQSFGPIMMLILIIGAPLVFARYFTVVISKVSDALWKFQGGILALSMRNMRKNKFSISRLAALLLIGVMLSFVSIISPATLTNWGNETSSYNLGADIYIQGLDSSNTTVWNSLMIDGVEAYTETQSLIIEGGPFAQYSILGIDPSTFHNAAYWRSTYDSKPLDEITAFMTLNSSIGIQDKVLKGLGLGIGDTLSILVDNATITKTYILDIEVDFEVFPNLVKTIPAQDKFGNYQPKDLPIIADLSVVKSMNEIVGGSSFATYVKVKSGASISTIVSQYRTMFQTNTSIIVQGLDEAKIDFFDLIETKILMSSLQGMLIVTLIVSVIAIGFFSVVTLSERKREIGILRALGMERNQIMMLLVFESVIMVMSAVLVGAILGVFVSSNLFIFITLVVGGTQRRGTVPPLELIIPWNLVIVFSSLLLVSGIIAAIIPAQRSAMRQTGNVLREE